MTTKRFENNRKSISKYTRYQQSGGQILRISDAFKVEVENLIMSWFGAKYLMEVKLLRKLSRGTDKFETVSHRHSGSSLMENEQKMDDNLDDDPIDFNLDISCFD